MLSKKEKRQKRHRKLRFKIKGTAKRPRLFIFKSLSHIYAQLIDDDKNKVLLSASDKDLKGDKKSEIKEDGKVVKMTKKVSTAFHLGELIAKKALDSKIDSVIFDRGGNIFHGRIKALADGARQGGLKF